MCCYCLRRPLPISNICYQQACLKREMEMRRGIRRRVLVLGARNLLTADGHHWIEPAAVANYSLRIALIDKRILALLHDLKAFAFKRDKSLSLLGCQSDCRNFHGGDSKLFTILQHLDHDSTCQSSEYTCWAKQDTKKFKTNWHLNSETTDDIRRLFSAILIWVRSKTSRKRHCTEQLYLGRRRYLTIIRY